MRRVIVGLLVLVLCGCGASKEMDGTKAFVDKAISDHIESWHCTKSEHYGEYYILKSKQLDGYCRIYPGWKKFTYNELRKQVDGFIKIKHFSGECGDNGHIWIPEDNFFYYKDAPDKYEAMRKAVEKKAKDLPEIKN